MKRFAILAALAAAFLLAACTSTQHAQQDPAVVTAKLVAQVKKACTVVQPTILSLQAQQAVLTADQLADLGTASALADKVCTAAAASATVEITSVANFVQAAFPVIIKIVNAAPLDPANKAAASAALTVAQVAVSAALAQ
ncbi:hypothetical protein [Herbaspirillum huttiense]|uniref:hypothetical protein n=1 Tax=Herbaspirillum huttiense TaxID=863372 RepID=UPI0031CEC1E6